MAKNSSNLGDLNDQQLDSLRGQLKSFVSGSLASSVGTTVPDKDVPHTSHSDSDGWV